MIITITCMSISSFVLSSLFLYNRMCRSWIICRRPHSCSFVLMHCDGVWLLTATGVSALLLTDQSGKPLAACGAEALRRIGVEAIFQHLAVDLNDMFYTQPEWPRLTDKARAEVEGSCLEPAVRACPSQPSHGRRPATGAPHGRMPPHPPINRRPRMGRSLLRFVAAAADREPRAASKDTEGPRVHVDTRPAPIGDFDFGAVKARFLETAT